MAPIEELSPSEAAVAKEPGAVVPATQTRTSACGQISNDDIQDWVSNVDEVTSQIQGIIDGTITDFDEFDRKLNIKERAKQIRLEEAREKRDRLIRLGTESKGEGQNYKWWCKRCFVQYTIDLPENTCSRCKQSDKMMTQEQRREELMGKLEVVKSEKAKHAFRKDKWVRWKKSQAMLRKSKYINYKAWEYWEPDTDTEDEGDPIVPKDNPEFQAMEADMLQRKKKTSERSKTAEKCRLRGNQCMKEGDFVQAIEHYEEGLEYRRDSKAIWTNKALAETKIYRWHDAIASCNKVIEYADIFEDGFTKSADACFKAFTRRAVALRALQRWQEALDDLDDALKLFPRDREARVLREKTCIALEEAQRAQGNEAAAPAENAPALGNVLAAGSVEEEVQAPSSTPPPAAPRPTGPVRVEIEESDDEAAAASAHSGSLAALSKQEYAALLAQLKRSSAERMRFCTRPGSEKAVEGKKDPMVSRKIDLRAEEVPEPSRLDDVLKDAERCAVLWKKGRSRNEPEDQQNRSDAAFVQVTAPRVLELLLVLAGPSDHHCELSVGAMRHLWPFLAEEAWRHMTLELLSEWSQRTVSVKAMAEFAGRNPDPSLGLLVSAATEEREENMVPPGLEARAKQATERMERGELGVEDALEDVLQSLTTASMAELAITTLGNVCLAGVGLPAFKESVAPFSEAIVAGISRHLRPESWRLRGRCAGALCNILRLGGSFADSAQSRCAEPLVQALREECGQGPANSPAAMLRAAREGQGGVRDELPAALGASASGRLLGALVNLVAVRPASARHLLDLGALDLATQLLDAEVLARPDAAAASGEEDAGTVALRAAQLASRLLSFDPSAPSVSLEADLLRRAHRIVGAAPDASTVRKAAACEADGHRSRQLEALDLSVRIISTMLLKTSGALDRLLERVPRIEELDADAQRPPATAPPAVPLAELTGRLLRLSRAVQPESYVQPDQEGGSPSRVRGNLALLFGALCEAQAHEDAPPALKELDFAPLVNIMIESMRKERGKVQHNLGVCVTQLARHPRYRQRVRDLNGIESLHQIQLPKVEKEKEEAMRLHRLRGVSGMD